MPHLTWPLCGPSIPGMSSFLKLSLPSDWVPPLPPPDLLTTHTSLHWLQLLLFPWNIYVHRTLSLAFSLHISPLSDFIEILASTSSIKINPHRCLQPRALSRALEFYIQLIQKAISLWVTHRHQILMSYMQLSYSTCKPIPSQWLRPPSVLKPWQKLRSQFCPFLFLPLLNYCSFLISPSNLPVS